MKKKQAKGQLPAEFADLEPFVGWALPTEGERYDKRENADMEEIQRFYDAMLSRVDAALDYLDRFALDSLPEEAKKLLYMIFSLATVSFSVEIWKQPKVPDSGIAKILSLEEPVPI